MESTPFKPVVPGIRTLWVLKFTDQNPSTFLPPTDLWIPSPFSNDWYNTNTQSHQKALNYLNEIQKKCDEIKNEVKDADESEKITDFLKNTSNLFKNLENLDDLMKDYNDFQKRFYSSPTEEEKPEEPKNPEDESK